MNSLRVLYTILQGLSQEDRFKLANVIGELARLPLEKESKHYPIQKGHRTKELTIALDKAVRNRIDVVLEHCLQLVGKRIVKWSE